MSKAKAAKDGRAPVENLPAESRRKRKQPEEEKENSPSKVAVPPPAEKTSPASESESEDSGMRCDFYLDFIYFYLSMSFPCSKVHRID